MDRRTIAIRLELIATRSKVVSENVSCGNANGADIEHCLKMVKEHMAEIEKLLDHERQTVNGTGRL